MAILSIFFAIIGLLTTAHIVDAVWQGPGVYILSSGAARLNLNLAAGSPPGTSVVATGAAPQPFNPQAWLISQISSAPGNPLQFTISNLGTGTALTNLNILPVSANQIIANSTTPSVNTQSWILNTTATGNGFVTINSVSIPGQVLQLSTANAGTPVIGAPLAGSGGNISQQWNLTLISN